MKVLSVIEGIWPRTVNNTGISALYSLQKEIATSSDIELHILTFVEKWADTSWKSWMDSESKEYGMVFHPIENKMLRKIPKLYFYYLKIVIVFYEIYLYKKYNFDVIIEYSSTPLLIARMSLLKHFINSKLVHYLCVNNFGMFGKNLLLGGKVDLILCATQKQKDDLDTLNSGNNIQLLPMSIDLDKFSPDAANVKKSVLEPTFKTVDKKRILYLGLIEKRKGIDVFLKAAKKIIDERNDILFIVATRKQRGNFYEYDKNKTKTIEIINELGQENFLYLEGDLDIPYLMQASDLVVIPINSLHGITGYPLTMMEAMACKKTVIMPDLPAITEIIEDGYNGLLFESGNHIDLSNRIIYALDAENVFEIGQNAYKSIKRFDHRTIARELINLLKTS